jgi:hypothetical protein
MRSVRGFLLVLLVAAVPPATARTVELANQTQTSRRWSWPTGEA